MMQSRGWTREWDSGLRNGRFHVDPRTGSDAQSGSVDAPLATVQAAVDRINPAGGHTILLHSGHHLGAVDFSRLDRATAPTVISRFGADQPVISGRAPLTGWDACDASDRPLVGENLKGLFKTELPGPVRSLEHLEALGLTSDGQPLTLASDLADTSEPFLFGSTEQFHRAARFVSRGDDIVEVHHPEVIRRYSAEQAAQMIAVVWRRGNRLARSTVELSQGNDALRLTSPAPAFPRDNPDLWRYALRNTTGRIRPGQWAFARHPDGTVTIYVRPHRDSGTPTDIHFAARSGGWDIAGAQHLHIQGLEFSDFSGATINEGIALGNIADKGRQTVNTGITIRNCGFFRCHNNMAHYGAIYFRRAAALSIEQCTFATCQNAGMLISAVDRLRLLNLRFDTLTYAAVRIYDTHDAIFAFSDLNRLARVAHANAATFYGTRDGRKIDRLLLYGLRISAANGYLTWQGASNLAMGFCDIAAPIYREDIRGTVDQNTPRGGQLHEDGSIAYLWNNLFRHNPAHHGGSGGALALGKEGVNLRYVLANNVIGGGGVSEPYLGKPRNDPSTEVARAANAYIKLAYWQGPRSGWQLQTSEVYLSRLIPVFGAADGGQFRVVSDNPLERLGGVDLRDMLRSGPASRHPEFDFSVDIDGNPIEWSNPRLGPFQVGWNAQIR